MSLLTDLVSYYKLDNNVNDSHGNNNGSGSGITYTTGKINEGFNSTDSNYICLNQVSPKPISSSFWIKLNSSTGSYVLHSYFAVYCTSGSDTKIRFGVYTGDFGTWAYSSELSLDNWHHVVVIWDGTTNANSYKIYVNGEPDGTGQSAGTSYATSTNHLYLGTRADQYSNGIDGTLDEVGIWSRALTSSEVSELYNGGAGLTYPFEHKKIGPFPMHLRK